MQAFSVSSEYISDLIAGLNLTLVIAMPASAPNPAIKSKGEIKIKQWRNCFEWLRDWRYRCGVRKP